MSGNSTLIAMLILVMTFTSQANSADAEPANIRKVGIVVFQLEPIFIAYQISGSVVDEIELPPDRTSTSDTMRIPTSRIAPVALTEYLVTNVESKIVEIFNSELEIDAVSIPTKDAPKNLRRFAKENGSIHSVDAFLFVGVRHVVSCLYDWATVPCGIDRRVMLLPTLATSNGELIWSHQSGSSACPSVGKGCPPSPGYVAKESDHICERYERC